MGSREHSTASDSSVADSGPVESRNNNPSNGSSPPKDIQVIHSISPDLEPSDDRDLFVFDKPESPPPNPTKGPSTDSENSSKTSLSATEKNGEGNKAEKKSSKSKSKEKDPEKKLSRTPSGKSGKVKHGKNNNTKTKRHSKSKLPVPKSSHRAEFKGKSNQHLKNVNKNQSIKDIILDDQRIRDSIFEAVTLTRTKNQTYEKSQIQINKAPKAKPQTIPISPKKSHSPKGKSSKQSRHSVKPLKKPHHHHHHNRESSHTSKKIPLDSKSDKSDTPGPGYRNYSETNPYTKTSAKNLHAKSSTGGGGNVSDIECNLKFMNQPFPLPFVGSSSPSQVKEVSDKLPTNNLSKPGTPAEVAPETDNNNPDNKDGKSQGKSADANKSESETDDLNSPSRTFSSRDSISPVSSNGIYKIAAWRRKIKRQLMNRKKESRITSENSSMKNVKPTTPPPPEKSHASKKKAHKHQKGYESPLVNLNSKISRRALKNGSTTSAVTITHVKQYTQPLPTVAHADNGPIPDVMKLLNTCESYMNWCRSLLLSEEQIKRYIEEIESELLLEPLPPTGECLKYEILRFGAFECIAFLGALCFFYVELNEFQIAQITIDKTRTVVSEALRKNYLGRDYIFSFDYVWDYLRLYASKREWDYKGKFIFFPEMDLRAFSSDFGSLGPKVKAGVYGLKAYFYYLIDEDFDKEVMTLRKAITFDPDGAEWRCCLQRTLRLRRKMAKRINSSASTHNHSYSVSDELRDGWKMIEVAPTHPFCILRFIEAMVDAANLELVKNKWNSNLFGKDNQFYNMASLAKFLGEWAKKVVQYVPRSVEANLTLADIYTKRLTLEFRDINFGKECIERALKAHPDSCRSNLRMAQFYLYVEKDYYKAESYFDAAFSLGEKSFKALLGLLFSMMRMLVQRQETILTVIKLQLDNNYWSKKQLATLHYLRGLTLFGCSEKIDEAFQEFITAYEMFPGSLDFKELPAVHKLFGWPTWPSLTMLNFGNIELEAQVYKEKHAESIDTKKREAIIAIIHLLTMAAEKDRKRQQQAAHRKHIAKSQPP